MPQIWVSDVLPLWLRFINIYTRRFKLLQSRARSFTMGSILPVIRRRVPVFTGVLRDRRGAVAVLLAIALSVIVGFAGLVSEVASWYYTTRSMQGAVDSAASTSAAELASATSSGLTVTGDQLRTAPRSIAATFNFTNGTGNTTVTVNNPPATTTNLTACSSPFTSFNCYVEVIISQPQTALLSALFMSTGPTITARAVALANLTATDDGCVVALSTAAKAIDISTVGSPALTLNDCAIYDNSPDNPGALTLGGAATINAKAAYIVGTVSGSGLTTTDGTFEGVNPILDPYAGRSFTWPSSKPNASAGTNCDQNNYNGSRPSIHRAQRLMCSATVSKSPATKPSTCAPASTSSTRGRWICKAAPSTPRRLRTSALYAPATQRAG